MADLVRARYKGVDYSLARFWVRRLGAQIIQSPTHNPDGSLRGPTSAESGRKAKPKTTVDKASTEKLAESSATDTEEND